MLSRQIVIENTQDLKNGNGLDFIKSIKPNIIFIFGSIEFFLDDEFVSLINKEFAECEILGCSTAGEISRKGFSEDSLIITAITLEKANFKIFSSKNIEEYTSKKAYDFFSSNNIKNIMLLSPGMNVEIGLFLKKLDNISEGNLNLFGGLAGDNGIFKQTYIIHNQIVSGDGLILIGFDDNLELLSSYSSSFGWNTIKNQEELKITETDKELIKKINDEPALSVYKKYLGPYAQALPSAGYIFPIEVKNTFKSILNIHEKEGGISIIGDILPNDLINIRKGSIKNLLKDAEEASKEINKLEENDLCFIFSCVARKMILGNQEIKKEFDIIKNNIKAKNYLGFYAYGEINKRKNENIIHNQAIALTVLRERK